MKQTNICRLSGEINHKNRHCDRHSAALGTPKKLTRLCTCTVSQKNYAKLFLSELRQISTVKIFGTKIANSLLGICIRIPTSGQ